MYRPKICSIELFRKCCLRCRMCHMWQVVEPDAGLDQAVLEGLADQLQEVLSGDKEVVFSGGEPLLHEQICEIIEFYSRKGFKVGLASNGVLITQETAGRLAAAGLKNIQLSFDSVYPETHDFLRGVKGAHDKVLKAAGYLAAYKDKISVCAQTVISGKNLGELAETVRFIKADARFAHISFMAVTTPFFTGAGDDWMAGGDFAYLWPDSQKLIDSTFDEIIQMKRDGYPIANPAAHLELFRAYFHNPRQRKAGIHCLLGDYVVGIDPAGDLRLCCFKPPIGNIREKPLVEILSAPEIEGVRQQMRGCSQVCNTLVNCFFREETYE